MYKLINAKETHADKILQYLTETCYWKEFIEGNSLNKNYRDFMLEWIVIPRLPITKVLVSESDESSAVGCIIAGTLEQIGAMPDYTPHLHPKVMEIFGPWFSYPVSDSVIIELYAVDNNIRGNGLGSQLLKEADSLAISNNKYCISCFVWTCFPDSIITTSKKGFMIHDCIKFNSPINFKLLYLEKTAKTVKSKDYFQSQEYINATNLLFS